MGFTFTQRFSSKLYTISKQFTVYESENTSTCICWQRFVKVLEWNDVYN